MQLLRKDNLPIPAQPTANRDQLDFYIATVFPLLPANTQRAYQGDWKSYIDFCTLSGRQSVTAGDELAWQMVSFAQHLAIVKGMAKTSISRRLAGVRKMLSIMGNQVPRNAIAEDSISSIISSVAKPSKQAPALLQTALAEFNASINPEDIKSLRAAALLNLAYDSMCRASEISPIRFSHITILPNGTGSLFIERSKNDQRAVGSYRHLTATAIRHLQNWTAVLTATGPDDFVFVPVSHMGRPRNSKRPKPISYKTILSIFKLIGSYSCHSSRVGAVLDQLDGNIGIGLIQLAGGWKNQNMVVSYGRNLDASKAGTAQLAAITGR